ncbi:MAG: hypothetical protein IJH34_15655 [Romboutsia sp.]|nr:hypothetical protein [Romboutsia sp.]
MKKISIKTIYLLCSVILSIGALFGINAYINSKIAPTQVWAFTRDLKANSKITETDVTLLDVPVSAVKSSFFVGEQSDLIGKYVYTDVYADQYVLQKQVVSKEDANPFNSMDTKELRKISIPGNMVSTAGNLTKGDRVDLLFHGIIEPEDGEKETRYGKVFMQNVPVYDLVTSQGAQITNESDVPEGAEYNPFYEYIVLAVTLPQAEEILTRIENNNISIISRFDDSESVQTSGFAINNVPTPDRLPFIGEAQVEGRDAVIIEDNY